MACKSIQSSSSRSNPMAWKYDVFVSFRGSDTRNNFTDHLFGALRRKGIHTFRDDTKLKKGEPISPELLQAIEGSHVLVVVFSKNYASSTWCLRELAKIVDCIEGSSGSHVLPVFYDVDPSEVRKQSGNYEKAFLEHEERFKEDLEMVVQVQRWRESLTKVANLSGWDIGDKPQYTEIEKIVGHIIGILGHISSSLPNDLVGIQSPIKELERLLHLGSNNEVRIVGICGMGGIGKTTLASVLYNRTSYLYDGCYFIDDVNKIYRDYGPIGIQKQLLCQILNEENYHTHHLSKTTHLIRSRLCHLRALVVLDNVFQAEQLEQLAINKEWLVAGSRIIIISRDEHVLREYGVDEVYNVQLLNGDNAVQLFCRNAFKCDDILTGYEGMTNDVLNYANGLPLAIRVLGSYLFGRNESEWKSALIKLRESPRKDIMDVLRISFDGLDDMEKEIFLDIACFFHKWQSQTVKAILDCCGFHSDIGLKILIDKSLISIDDRTIKMHDLLRELGKSIVREKSPNEPGRWSRLWRHMDFHKVMLQKTATEYIEAIFLPQYLEENQENTTLKAEALSQMRHLRLLVLHHVNISGSLNFLSNDIGYLEWDNYPLTYLPSNFQPDKLVELILPHSSIKQLWKGMKPLNNLRNLDLHHSKKLINVTNFQVVPNLVSLNLEGCINLVWIDESIDLLEKLSSLILKKCKSLVSIPSSIFCLSFLENLNLSGCSRLLSNQLLEKARNGDNLKKLDTSQSSIQCQLTSSVHKILMLPWHLLYPERHVGSIDRLGHYLPQLSSLIHLDLSFCNLYQIPDAIGGLCCLERLNLGGNNFVTLPASINQLSKLRWLNLEHCQCLKYLPELPPITTDTCKGTVGLYIFNCPNLNDIECCCRTIFSWVMQVVQVSLQSSAPAYEIEVVIPGTKIPRWFNEQNEGSSIKLDPYPILNDDNWIGIAYCATLAHEDSTHFGDRLKGRIVFMFECEGAGIGHEIPIHLRKDQVKIESDHMLLILVSRENFMHVYEGYFKESKCDLGGFELGIITSSRQGLRLKVKSCGYRLVFKEDIEQLNPTMMQSRSSSGQKGKLINNHSHNHQVDKEEIL